MDCSNPVIAENELVGSWLAVSWSATNAQYRANVLLFLQTLRQRGAQPWLLVNAEPYTDSTAGDWWRHVADVAGIVREVYFPAPLIYRRGPIYGNRQLRQSLRAGPPLQARDHSRDLVGDHSDPQAERRPGAGVLERVRARGRAAGGTRVVFGHRRR